MHLDKIHRRHIKYLGLCRKWKYKIMALSQESSSGTSSEGQLFLSYIKRLSVLNTFSHVCTNICNAQVHTTNRKWDIRALKTTEHKTKKKKAIARMNFKEITSFPMSFGQRGWRIFPDYWFDFDIDYSSVDVIPRLVKWHYKKELHWPSPEMVPAARPVLFFLIKGAWVHRLMPYLQTFKASQVFIESTTNLYSCWTWQISPKK